jgi:hypothetical protein
MRNVTCFLLVAGLGLAAVVGSPIARKLEKKSILESASSVAAEVDQRLDGPQHIGDEALMEASPGATLERTKKQASTTFCVEIRHNKPTQVDCEEIHRPHPPLPPPPPIHHLPEPIPEIHVHPPPPPPPIVIPQQPPPPPPPINIQVPCEPEMAAYVIQPPSEVVYAPTGNCAPQLPTVIHSGGAGAGVQVIHLPSSIPTGGHGAAGHGAHGGLTIHSQPSLPVHAHEPAPVHTHAIQTQQPVQVHTHAIQTQQPVQVHTHAIQTQQPVQVHTHGSVQGGLYQQLSPGIECSCQSAQPGIVIQRTQGAVSPSNEALALQFLQDIQRNSNNNNSQQSPGATGSVVVQVRLPPTPLPRANNSVSPGECLARLENSVIQNPNPPGYKY